jgi:hypothetical protein
MGGACSAYGREERHLQDFGGIDLRERDQFEDTGVDGRIILSWIFKSWNVKVWTGSSWLRIGTVGGH